jgi:hypothetical protein
LGPDVYGRAAIATSTCHLSPKLIKRLKEIGDRALLHTRITRDRTGKTGKREHGREKARCRPRVSQEQGLLWVDKFALLPVNNKGRAVLFDGHPEVLEDLTRHVRIIAFKRAI